MICAIREMKPAREVLDGVALLHRGVMAGIMPPGRPFDAPRQSETQNLAATR